MKIYKKLISASFLSATLLVGASSCSKYEEGPAFSLRSKKSRVANTWEVKKAMEDGKDVTNDYEQYQLRLLQDGDARLTAIYTSGNFTWEYETDGTWEFSNDKEDLQLDMENDDADFTYQILKLKEKEMWLREKGGDTELHLEPFE